jgi:hypothetical protein
MTISGICVVFEKQMVLRTKRFIRVRNVRAAGRCQEEVQYDSDLSPSPLLEHHQYIIVSNVAASGVSKHWIKAGKPSHVAALWRLTCPDRHTAGIAVPGRHDGAPGKSSGGAWMLSTIIASR